MKNMTRNGIFIQTENLNNTNKILNHRMFKIFKISKNIG